MRSPDLREEPHNVDQNQNPSERVNATYQDG